MKIIEKQDMSQIDSTKSEVHLYEDEKTISQQNGFKKLNNPYEPTE